MEPNNKNGDFKEYRRLILSKLESLNDRYEKLDRKLDARVGEINKSLLGISKDIVRLQTKAGAWGAVGGAIFGALISVIIRLAVK